MILFSACDRKVNQAAKEKRMKILIREQFKISNTLLEEETEELDKIKN